MTHPSAIRFTQGMCGMNISGGQAGSRDGAGHPTRPERGDPDTPRRIRVGLPIVLCGAGTFVHRDCPKVAMASDTRVGTGRLPLPIWTRDGGPGIPQILGRPT